MFFIIVYTYTYIYETFKNQSLTGLQNKTKNRKKHFIIYKVIYTTFQFV